LTNEISQGLQRENMEYLPDPKLRFGHTSETYGPYMMVFGGWDGSVTLNDLNIFDLRHHIWMAPRNVTGEVKGRYRHSSSATDKSMFIFGGIDQQ